MEEIDCIFCGGKSSEFIKEDGYSGKKCKECQLIYISPRPSLKDIVDIYGHDNAQISAQTHIESNFFKSLYAKHNLKIITSYRRGGSLLELGAGAGYFLDEARKKGFEPYGIELNHIQSKHIRDNLHIPCIESPLDISIYDYRKFDIIYHCDLLSHFYDPISEFQTMNEMLTDDGLLIFETGNFAEIEPQYLRYIDKFQYPDHLFFFSTKSIYELLDRAGFEVVEIYKYSLIPQLKLKFALVKLLSLLKNSKEIDSIGDSDDMSAVERASTNSSSIVKKYLRYTYQYLTYLLRYRVGAIAPKRGRPQTLIVIAKRVGL
ncbi:cytidylyltransferase domain protein [hydrothermal vent metagenome]|uniref:Cytidylyltransferase domain protein n=1 Tax=hydrothermal vent metagenome TaxID=652676 RepID=A0A1W1BSB1_9ZZZZ